MLIPRRQANASLMKAPQTPTPLHLMDFHKMQRGIAVARMDAFTNPDIDGGC